MAQERNLFETHWLKGQVIKVTYIDDQTGYVVATLDCGAPFGAVTVVGNLIALGPGEILEIEGSWEKHPKYGRQFRVSSHRWVRPGSKKAIEKYLGSGLIKGIGPMMAKRIVEKFGQSTLEIIEKDIHKLAQVEGIGPKRIEMIRKAWDGQRDIRDLMLFLQEHNLSHSLAPKIFKAYGNSSISVIRQNPFKLADSVYGIGFRTADAISEKLGFERESPLRMEAGIRHVLQKMAEDGHLFCPYEELVSRGAELLKVDEALVGETVKRLVRSRDLVLEGAEGVEGGAVFLRRFHLYETGISRHLARILTGPGSLGNMDLAKSIAWAGQQMGLCLAGEQVRAIEAAFKHKVVVITGGPGTGKTTIIDAIVKIAGRAGAKVALAAPTGRASKRMEQATGLEAKTIHRLLDFQPQKGGFQKDEHSPIDAQIVIIDEVSMLDAPLAYYLLRAVSTEASLILVGDKDQLPSVGPGNVLSDLLGCRKLPVVALKNIFRQAARSLIVTNAHRINNGRMPVDRAQAPATASDYYFIEQTNPEEALRIIVELVTSRIPKRFRLDPLTQIQLICPMHKGILGTQNVNSVLQKALNPHAALASPSLKGLKEGDKVMQVKNNYEKTVFNGDIGYVEAVDQEGGEVIVKFGGKRVNYAPYELGELSLAYAITVHKSQGSEYPAVILPLTEEHYIMLQRNLLYTAVTRAKRLLVMVGTKRALSIAVRNQKATHRYTLLAQRLRSLL